MLRKAAKRIEREDRERKARAKASRKARDKALRRDEEDRLVGRKALHEVATDASKGYARVEAARTLLKIEG